MVLLFGGFNGEDVVVDILYYCFDYGIVVVLFGGGISVVGGFDFVCNDFCVVIFLDMWCFDWLYWIDEVFGEVELEVGVIGLEVECLFGEYGFLFGYFL